MRRVTTQSVLCTILLTQAVVLLSSCNTDASQIGFSPSLSKNNKLNAQLKEDQGTYQGSQAYNSSLFTGEDVNGQTGSLNVAKSLINVPGVNKDIDLNFKLIYSSTSTQKGILHLPQGWSYQMSYVMNNTSVNIDGSSYIIDKDWEDSSGYASGLKYINNHAIKFTEVLPDVSLKCNNDKLSYHYIYNDADGSHQYFDLSGKLIAKDNRFGSCISYHYNGYGDLYSLYLDHIEDSYGQSYKFNYSPNKVSVVSAGRNVSSFEYSNNGVLSASDAMGYKTQYGYTAIANKLVLNKISYPSGLITNINYNQLPVISCGNADNILLAVSKLIHTGGGILNETSYSYGTSTGSANYTGYSLGSAKYCMGGNHDSLMDSGNGSFIYDVLITKSGDSNSPKQVSQVYYNYLHLPTKKDDLNSSGAVQKEVIYDYDISPDKTLRSASYSQPIKITDKSLSTTISVTQNKYNEYNLLTSSDANILGGIKSSKVISYFPEVFYLPQETITTDNTNGSTIKVKNTLGNNKTISSSTLYHNGSGWKQHQFTYDDLGRMTNDTISWAGGSHHGVNSSNMAYQYSYSDGILTTVKTDGSGNKHTTQTSTTLSGSKVLKEISPSGKSITYAYDAIGRELSMTSPMGHKVTSLYHVAASDGSNSVIKTNPLGYKLIIDYDSLGRVSKVTDNGGSGSGSRLVEADTYNMIGGVSGKTDKLGNTLKYAYDEFGRVIMQTDALNNIKTIVYNDQQLKTQILLNSQPLNDKITDGAGNVVSNIMYSAGKSTAISSSSYDAFGNKVREISTVNGEKAYTNNYTYNPEGKLIHSSKINYDGITEAISTDIDLLGKMLSITTITSGKGLHNSDSQVYNAIGQLTRVNNNLKQNKSMSYNSDGELIGVKEYDGTTTSYTYDADGNQTSYSRGGVTVNKSYDEAGNLVGISDAGNIIKYTYTNTGLLTSVQYPDGKNIRYSYDSKDLLVSKNNVFNIATNYGYDNTGRVTSINMLQSNLQYSYANGQLINGKYGMLNGMSLVNNGGVVISHKYSYNDWDKLSSDEIVQGGNLISISYQYDWLQKLSQLALKSNLPDSTLNALKTFSYDSLSELSEAQYAYFESSGTRIVNESYKYDNNKNVINYTKDGVSQNYTYNGIDQLTAVNGSAIAYDKSGNMLNDNDGNQYSYNALNQLVKVISKQGEVKYTYYSNGMLKNKSSLANDLLFYYDNGHVDAIQSNDSKKIANQDNLLLSSSGSPIASYRGNNPTYYLQVANSTVGLIDKDNNLINDYKYLSYGETSSKSPTDAAQSFLWNQEYTDTDTNLVYLRARFYNPKLMHFMNADTVDTNNPYSFGNGDPINNIDPSGHLSEEARWGIGIAGVLIGIGGAVASIASFGTSAAAAATADAAIASAAAAGEAATEAVVATEVAGDAISVTNVAAASGDATIAGSSAANPVITTGALLRGLVNMTSSAMTNGAYTNSWDGARDGALQALSFNILIEGFTANSAKLGIVKYLKSDGFLKNNVGKLSGISYKYAFNDIISFEEQSGMRLALYDQDPQVRASVVSFFLKNNKSVLDKYTKFYGTRFMLDLMDHNNPIDPEETFTNGILYGHLQQDQLNILRYWEDITP